MDNQKGIKRYNLNLPEDLFNEIEVLAKTRQTTVVDLLRRFIKLGLLAVKIEEAGSELLVKEGETIKRIVML